MYKVILTNHRQHVKLMYSSKSLNFSYKKFNKLKRENTKVIFPKKINNSKGMTECKYEIYLIKKIEDGDENRLIRDDMGRLIEEENIVEDWVIIDSAPFNIEETFWLFGKDPIKERVNIKDILKVMTKGVSKDGLKSKRIIMVQNKIVMSNESEFDMIICKNKSECARLYRELFIANGFAKIKGLNFFGYVSEYDITALYDFISEKTGWKRSKVVRRTTSDGSKKKTN